MSPRPALAAVLAALAALALGRPAAAELVPGLLAPAIDATASPGATPPTEEGLRGRFTLLEFVRAGCPNCQREVPQVNRLHAAFAPRGVRVLAVGYEPKRDLDGFVAAWGVRVPVAYATIDAIRDYDVVHLPRAFLVDPSGRIAWVGAPGELRDDVLARLLGRAPVLPDLPPSLAPAGELARQGKYADADRALAAALGGEALPEGDRRVAKAARDWFAWYAGAALDGAEVDVMEGRPHDAVRVLDRLVQAFAGTPTAETAKQRADAVRADPSAQATVRAHEALANARRAAKRLSLRDRLALFRDLARTAEDEAVRERARIHVSDLEAELRRTGGGA